MPHQDLMDDGELPAEFLDQYPALEPPPDPNRVTVRWMLGVMGIAFVFVLVMAAGQWWQINSRLPPLATRTPMLNLEQGCFVKNERNEPVEIFAAPDSGTTLVGRINPREFRRVVQQGTNWHSIESAVTPDWVQAGQVELVGSCE